MNFSSIVINVNQALNNQNIKRPPVVVVLGHVDHGKTSLLDYIRKANIAGREAGGITQATGAYEIEHNNEKITFIDTPGHSAFTKMRSRGTSVADIAILVVAADDGVKPQTAESIKILKESNTPFIVAINKIDKNNADIERTKQSLAENEVFLEGYGGNISFQLISAKTGEGINDLLDLLLLAVELEELTYSKNNIGQGVVIESKMSKQRGNEVSIIIKDGIFKRGDEISTESAQGKIKILEDFKGDVVSELTASSPAVIIGFEKLPKIGEECVIGNIKKDEEIEIKTQVKITDNKQILNLILKADTSGSLEALKYSIDPIIEKNKEDVRLIIKDTGVGEITDGDIKHAVTTSSKIIGFNVQVSRAALKLSEIHKTDIIESKIIYELLQKIEEYIERVKNPVIIKNILNILAIFSKQGSKQTVGGVVLSGVIKKGNTIEITREEKVLGRAKITNLQSGKNEINQIEEGKECGLVLNFSSGEEAQVGDNLVVI
ncbi:MAG: hypothetical protein COV57_03380 [Candidatus Liptonbacteria bacterium CG11_big_fil_rev_8_21_14_0_20_35_14]|uniref:Tr-type G domain-containing protein n=1 Tax=Candidatus Liptonbacteria bacterium CG11_big_fil_rev_8_21_14_0_20_35_14 TaxID=1974634 RepID=A0A2H0N918_9BACT|nr:MAG: hypothetical protein COV57_03380 [Candidatus Liptonbacteria bacterium CG11_big_fil_rev_8_21_14_0_20_35_14]